MIPSGPARGYPEEDLAGITGWTLLFGYIGSMSMYAYAFGSFAEGLEPVPDTLFGLPLRPVLSVLGVAAFAALNLLRARSTGLAEDVMALPTSIAVYCQTTPFVFRCRPIRRQPTWTGSPGRPTSRCRSSGFRGGCGPDGAA